MGNGNNKGAATTLEETVSYLIASATQFIPRLGQIIGTIGQVCRYRVWSRSLGCKQYRTRSKLWETEVLPLIKNLDQLTVMEFGVAFGDTSRFWLERLPREGIRYWGFDRFTGLPTSWRNLPEGTFSSNGIAPDIKDSRIRWYVGDVEDTVKKEIISTAIGRKFLMFDLDLYGPSLHVWSVVSEYLTSGDLLWFDEAFDQDEGIILSNYVFPTVDAVCLASSPMGILLLIK